ncbi:MAG: ATP-binding cassette domain-containing protein [Gemmatimonadota bacterium]|nr:MAG: ATP-binding cassette domain-containing protein [Gemmatimonadota bacterium]
MVEVAVRCQGLEKRYGDVVAVDGLDLEVYAGECFGLLGPNGAGKTTTVEILEGLLQPDAGELEILGTHWGTDDRALRQRLGVQLQETQLAEKLTVEETLRLFRSFFDRGRSIDEVLRIVELEEKRAAWVSRLSGGQQQRLAVACALVSEPELLFLDEPTTGLDPQSRRGLWDLVLDFKASGRTVLLTTHYMEEAERLCDRVAIVDRGRVIALGTPGELISRLGGEHVVEFALANDDPAVDNWLRHVEGVQDVRREREGIFLTVREVHRTVPALLSALRRHDVELTSFTTHHASLEDVFVSLTGRHLRDE